MTTDPISDLLTRIRNAVAAKHATVAIPHSKIKEQIAKILSENHFVSSYSVSGEGVFKKLDIVLPGTTSVKQISSLVRLSKPGRRVYTSATEIPVVLSGRGIVIVSTSSGVMTGRDARQKGLGGELICKVW